ncbi:peptide/nickel transport system ATP-binding protein/peptide/nickel transport system ATP-binding protein [Verrucomicrobium sp. GAS474]|uniref:ABC transporter ATP-binding protein n=1 Tax=Verrucomicrobium sp. GAS474 TaxID=1882831 RepID=UPI00087D4D4A|nr:ABC transporter ATP-binding protein [Verrucomicrobium sp. GAS474]SDT96703.1 peptide/nickel transport system ATP-binding protein/peptide/nickel transport system ATP-binding protein [Verrucomicrobium sp. GAS474]
MADFHDLLRVENLTVDFASEGRSHRAVDGVSFTIPSSKTVAVVGESGSGKSVTALALTRLLPASAKIGGSLAFEGRNVLTASPEELRRLRGGQIAYVFQEPSTSLNPVFTIGEQIAEAISLHRRGLSRKQVAEEVVASLARVGIRDPETRHRDYPHQLSGGMQQRAMIAMALACQPKLLIADEPTTALDVTIQAQIIDLLRDLKASLNMSILLITHNFGIVKGFADEVVVMFRGKIVEHGPTAEVLENPQHPYTKALIACVPRLGQKRERLVTIDHSTLSS